MTRYLRRAWMWIVLFLLAFLPRVIYPVSRSGNWYQRSLQFVYELGQGDWASTMLSYHPGVTTMWLSGAGLKIYSLLSGYSLVELAQESQRAPEVVFGAYTAGVVPLALVISGGIVLAAVLIGRLFDRRMGLIAGVLLALDPFLLSQSKTLHLDGLLTILMLLSALYLMLYVEKGHGRFLLYSAIFFGLALLTKSPSLFLLPFATLYLSVSNLRHPEEGAALRERLLEQGRLFLRVGLTLVAWLGIAVGIVFLLFPALWVQPGETLRFMGGNVMRHLVQYHIHPTFFAGEVYVENNPGILYYGATLLWRTTFVTLPMFLLACVLAVKGLLREKRPSLILWFIIYAGAFVVQMSLSHRQEARYIVPMFAAVDVLAAYGVVSLLDWLAARVQPRWLYRIAVLVLLVQAALIFSFHPYYGLHANYLLGGPKTAVHVIALQEQAEGLEQAAQYLNSLPGGEQKSVSIHEINAIVLERYFRGQIDASIPNANTDYRIYYRQHILRNLGLGEGWGALWEADQQREPLFTVERGGLTYVWVYDNENQ